MKKFIVRCKNYNNFIIDGSIIEAENKAQAINFYCYERSTIINDMCKFDSITVEEYKE